MIRLDLSYFYRMRTNFAALRDMPEEGPLADVWLTLFNASLTLRTLYGETVLASSLRTSRGPADRFATALNEMINAPEGTDYNQYKKANLVSLLDGFEAVLMSEMAVADAYMVTDKAPYSTIKLATGNAGLFPADVALKVPAVMDDLDSAGKCLAFELSTACGFHIMRALEAVLLRYTEVLTGTVVTKAKQRNMGAYLRLLGQHAVGDPKVIAALDQIRNLHRNPISHPEETLTVEEAISLLGMARSAAAAMLPRIPEQEFTLTAEPDLSAGVIKGLGAPKGEDGS